MALPGISTCLAIGALVISLYLYCRLLALWPILPQHVRLVQANGQGLEDEEDSSTGILLYLLVFSITIVSLCTVVRLLGKAWVYYKKYTIPE